MADGDRFKINVTYQVNAVLCTNGYYVEQTATVGGDNADDPDQAWQNTLEALFKACLSNEAVIACYSTKRLTPSEGPTFTRFVSVPGDEVVDALPSNSFVGISSYGLDGGAPAKRVRNNQMISGIPENFVVNNALNTAGLVAFDAFRDALGSTIANAAGDTYKFLVRQGQGTTPETYLYFDSSGDVLRPILRSMRRRTTNLCAAP